MAAESFDWPESPHYDFAVVADGSGTTDDKPCGCYAAVFDRNAGTVEELGAALSNGSNNFSEMLPFVLAFRRIRAVAKGRGLRTVRVLCVSDSEVVVKGARKEYGRHANQELWAALEFFENTRWGPDVELQLDWKHVPRNSVAAHAVADDVSRQWRLVAESFIAQRAILTANEES